MKTVTLLASAAIALVVLSQITWNVYGSFPVAALLGVTSVIFAILACVHYGMASDVRASLLARFDRHIKRMSDEDERRKTARAVKAIR